MDVLLLKARSRYGATRLFVDEAAAAFERAGHATLVVDIPDTGNEADFAGAAAAGPRFDLVYSIGLFGESRDSNGRSIAQVVGAPHVLQYVDYPLSHFHRLSGTSPDTVLLTVDPSHAEAVRSVYGEARFPHLGVCFHGAVGAPHAPALDGDAEAWAAARDIPILFPASFYKPRQPLWHKLDAATRAVFDSAVEIALGAESVPALDAFDEALDRHGGHLLGHARAEMRINAFAVHEHVREHRRLALLKAVTQARLPLHVVGAEWDQDLDDFDTVTYLGEQDLSQVLALMRRSRIVLNTNANFGRGSHERPLSAMVAGAVAATDASGFYRDAFGEAVITYEWLRLDEGVETLARALERPEALFARAGAGHALVSAGHRWDHRIATILSAAGLRSGR